MNLVKFIVRCAVGVVFCIAATSCKTIRTQQIADLQPTAQEQIVAPGGNLELVWGEGAFTEGPTAAPDGTILFTDIPTSRILRYFPDRKKTYVFAENSGRANGLTTDYDGNLLVCEGANGGRRRVSKITADGKVSVVTDNYLNKKFNSPNDIATSIHGWIYFTDPRYGGKEPMELDFEGVFAVRRGYTIVATRQVERPNGIVITTDGRQAYVADNNNRPGGAQQLLRFDIREGGTFTNRKVLVDFGSDRRGIDGMALDEKGNIYAAAGKGKNAGVYVFSPSAELLAFIQTPGFATNCAFGGPKDPKTLYVTAMAKPAANGQRAKYGLFRIPLQNAGAFQP